MFYNRLYVEINDSRIAMKEEKPVLIRLNEKQDQRKKGAYQKISAAALAVCWIQRSYRYSFTPSLQLGGTVSINK